MSNLFQISLFGYSKKAVNHYVSQRSEEFSKKLLEKDLEHREELKSLQEQVERLAKENEELKGVRQEIAEALISAKAYAVDLKRKAEEDAQAKRMMNMAYQETEFRRILSMAEKIDGLQQEFHSTLERMDRELSSYKEEVQGLREAARTESEANEARFVQKEEKV